jgi:hypothetical protein
MIQYSYPSPQYGDVLFIRSREKSSFVSAYLQKYLLDPLARTSTRLFSHVAVAIDGSWALEAVPDEPSDCPDDEVGKLAEWTGVCLKHGVRIVHVADLIIPARRHALDFAVLRPGSEILASAKSLLATSPEIVELIGNAYSVDRLKATVESAIGFALPRMIKKNFFDWSSNPEDLATKMGVDAEFRAKVAQGVLELDLKLQSATYFCSQLVVELLHRANILSESEKLDDITPTGLFNVLTHHKPDWVDVTDTDYSREAVECMTQVSVSSLRDSYATQLALIRLALMGIAVSNNFAVTQAGVEAMTRSCDKWNGILNKINPRKSEAGSGGADKT